jgi:hypothetical protein
MCSKAAMLRGSRSHDALRRVTSHHFQSRFREGQAFFATNKHHTITSTNQCDVSVGLTQSVTQLVAFAVLCRS